MCKSVINRAAAQCLWASLFLLLWLAGSAPVAWGPGVGPPAGERSAEVRVKFFPGQEGIGSMALSRWSVRMGAPGAALDPRLPVDAPLLQPHVALSQIGWYVYRLAPGQQADQVASAL